MKTMGTEIAGKFIKKIVELMTDTAEGFAALEKIAFAEARNHAAGLHTAGRITRKRRADKNI